ncbi:CHAT domain-containing protein [Corallococcus praedator]|uniref:CHAT domain-containing protein n=1 Tax=Corallococcus praedator TaxID=2316724 RepID=A0ABX9QPU4_9BACT|nr:MULTISPECIES: tetratricopeptide repeat protein [Corallococcus]RKH35747.1 CHAT domain-containing protein [Corallococcus sp. CA031C]RKI14005.1 CHAT domain-containing protein [Corallococcus praedator]
MRCMLGWMVVVVLCCSAGAATAEAPGDARLREAQAAFDAATKLMDAGRYPEAHGPAAQALALRESALGSTHPDVAGALDLVGELYQRQDDVPHAEPLLQRALALREATLGKAHPDVALTLTLLGILYKDQGLYAQAEPLFLRALTLRETGLGAAHPLVARTLSNLANLYSDQGANERAEPLYLRALTIREKAFGNNHPQVATSLNNLAILYKDQGLYERAEPLYLRALAIREEALGKNHPEVAASLHGLANLYVGQGLYERAEPLFLRAIAIFEAALGDKHSHVASSLDDLANAYSEQGLHSRAEPLHLRALAIREEALGKNHFEVGVSLNNLALLYMEQGLYERAEPLFLRSLAILRAALGDNHPLIATSFENLALLAKEQGLYDRAVTFHQRALALREVVLGKNHPDLATTLHNIANVYLDQGGNEDRAEPLLKRALAIQEAALGDTHPFVASSLASLARIHLSRGRYERAEPLWKRALAIQEATLGDTHPSIAQSLHGLALLHLARHRRAAALPLLTRAFDISEQRLRQEALDFSESRLAHFLQLLRADEQGLYAVLRAWPQDASVRRLALSAVLLRKGRSVEETAEISRSLSRSLGARDRDTFERLRGLRTQRAALSLGGPGELTPVDYQQRLKSLADQGDALEADLAKRSAPLRALTALPPTAEIVDRVAASLPRDGALIEFIAYEDSPVLPTPGKPRAKKPGPLRYLALVLFPDASTRALDLGPAAPIDRAATRLRDALARRDVQSQASARALHDIAFRPLLPLLGNTRRLFLSPDGHLGLVPFAALHDGRDYLVETWDFTYLTSGKDLLRRPQDTSAVSSVVVFADPDFQAAPGTAPRAPSPAERSAPLERFFSTSRAEDIAATPWAALPGSRAEAEDIQRLLPQAQLLLGPEATKERLLHLPTPGVLHLATHGFFLDDAPAPSDSRAVVHFGVLGEGALTRPVPDPLLRSGLILAGASAPAPDAARPPAASAMVTALELAGLDLWGTQLVVLSACDTGRGDVKPGQGVYGLRRAFFVAGAETVVMSLWKVNDGATHPLMEAYYRHLLSGQGRATALREAMRSFRRTWPHPHYWAPFITVGSDAPLRALATGAPSHPDAKPTEAR